MDDVQQEYLGGSPEKENVINCLHTCSLDGQIHKKERTLNPVQWNM